MPLYEYKCDTCSTVFEIIQKFSDQPLTEHAGCGGAVHRLISASALQFKGSGWYITDYAKSGDSKAKNGPEGGKKEGGKEGGKESSEKTSKKEAASTSSSDSSSSSGTKDSSGSSGSSSSSGSSGSASKSSNS